MDTNQILARPGIILSQAQRQSYFSDGYLLLPGIIDQSWLQRIKDVSQLFVERSKSYTKADAAFDLEPGHCADNPRLRRLSYPVDHHEVFREFAFKSLIVDVAEDLLGPDVCYHHSKLNYKWSRGGEEIKWHQDIQYWPHTDFSPLTIGVYLEDVDDEMGPMGILPNSHRGQIFDLQDSTGRWVGAIQEQDLKNLDLSQIDYLKGPAGSVTVHNCCAVHGSAPNVSNRVRPLLLQTYTSGDSIPLQSIGTNGNGQYANTLVRGGRPDYIEVDGREIPVAPDYSPGSSRSYTSIMDIQQQTDDQ